MRLSKEAFEHRRDMNIKFIDTPVSEISYNMGFDEGYAFARNELRHQIAGHLGIIRGRTYVTDKMAHEYSEEITKILFGETE